MRATFSWEISSLSYLRSRRFCESLENGDGHWLCGESESSLLCESSWDCCCCDWPPTIDGFIILDASVRMCAIRSSAIPLSSPRPNEGKPASDPAMLSESVQKIYYDWLPLHTTWRGNVLTCYWNILIWNMPERVEVQLYVPIVYYDLWCDQILLLFQISRFESSLQLHILFSLRLWYVCGCFSASCNKNAEIAKWNWHTVIKLNTYILL